MAEIVPRWEWRAFGDAFGAADELLGDREAKSVQESEEHYVVSRNSNASVKVRDGLMDVKRLQQVNDEGFELWLPVLKASFPLTSQDVGEVFSALEVDSPPTDRESLTFDEFASHSELLAILVRKRRVHFLIDDCMVERTEVRVGDRVTRTIAIESPDPDLVKATIARLGLGGRPNVCMAKGLKTLVGFGTQRFAVIDVGTNSVKFHIGERRADGTWATVVDRAEVTRLGEGLDASGELADEAMQRTVAAIATVVDEARRADVSDIAAVGTAGLRAAPNRASFINAVAQRADITVEVISGEEEARLAYIATVSSLPIGDGSVVVFDSGGGSSQFTFAEEQFSVEVGAVRCAERYGLGGIVADDALERALAGISSDLGRLRGRPSVDAIVGMGGTATNLAAVKHGLPAYDPDVAHGTVLDLREIDRQIEMYRKQDAEQRRTIRGLQPNRAEVILAGACIVRSVLTNLGHDSLTVSDRGLRHGVLADRFGGAQFAGGSGRA